jgi:pyruvate carboxylase subunit B
MRTFNVFVDNEYFNVEVEPTGGAPVISLPAGGMPAAAPAAAPAPAAAAPAPAAAPAETPAAAPAAPAPAAVEGTPMNAPMPGMIVSYEKNVGDAVSEGETVLVLEAMKMENALAAPCSGTVQAINYKSGDSVAKGDVLCVIG